MSKKLEDVRYALTAYLYWLGEWKYKDGGSTGDWPELSSGDLFTYERPSDKRTEAVLYSKAELESGAL